MLKIQGIVGVIITKIAFIVSLSRNFSLILHFPSWRHTLFLFICVEMQDKFVLFFLLFGLGSSNVESSELVFSFLSIIFFNVFCERFYFDDSQTWSVLSSFSITIVVVSSCFIAFTMLSSKPLFMQYCQQFGFVWCFLFQLSDLIGIGLSKTCRSVKETVTITSWPEATSFKTQ